MKTKIVYCLVSDGQDYYYEQLLISLCSLRRHNPAAEVEVVCDNDTNTTLTGTRHLAQNVRMWWVNYLYHHPKLYFTAQRLIIVIYFGLNPNFAQNGDFLTDRITDGKWVRKADKEMSHVASFFIRVWNYHIGNH